jgi:hypothetical protein
MRRRPSRIHALAALAFLVTGSFAAPLHAPAAAASYASDSHRVVDGGTMLPGASFGAQSRIAELGSEGNAGPAGRLPARTTQPFAWSRSGAASDPARASRALATVSASIDFSSRLALLRAGLPGWRSTAPPPFSVQR